jgi:hypothetical protein
MVVDTPSESTSDATPEQVEEVEGQRYRTSNDPEDLANESSEIILDDLPIDSLVDERGDTLSIEQAQELIPEAVLKVLKEKFNGSLENCRPVKDYDRLC